MDVLVKIFGKGECLEAKALFALRHTTVTIRNKVEKHKARQTRIVVLKGKSNSSYNQETCVLHFLH